MRRIEDGIEIAVLLFSLELTWAEVHESLLSKGLNIYEAHNCMQAATILLNPFSEKDTLPG